MLGFNRCAIIYRRGAVLIAGIRLSPGTYHVTPSVEHQSHMYMRCGSDREDVFEVDFTGAFFYFTVTFHPFIPVRAFTPLPQSSSAS